MRYTILWHEDALKDLKNIDNKDAKKIVDKVENYLTQNPSKLGKPLIGHLQGLFRYRIGKYRIIYHIQENKLVVLVLKVGRRDKIYRR